jgi:hypothetical protein
LLDKLTYQVIATGIAIIPDITGAIVEHALPALFTVGRHDNN